ncbi:hypothetical protein TI03_01485 [Achromatium sp. WMS1]|nr:hypothetical protein TI03_01485 [Achromatium sp. WMS1]
MAQILTRLAGYHTPPPVSWWPPAPGWWLLGVFGLLSIIIGVWLWLRRRYRRSAAFLAQAELDRLRTELTNNTDTKYFICSLSRLLRRFAISKFSQHTVAGLTGQNWLQFLDTHSGQKRFQVKPGCLLIEAPYTATTKTISVTTALELADLVEDWIRNNQDVQLSQ